jgi:hypothetical protein
MPIYKGMTKKKNKNSYTVDYTKKTVTLHYNGEVFKFDLNEGDVGDFWHSFTTKAGVIKDVNFVQDDAGEAPGFSVYGVKKSKGGFLIDTSDEEYIENFKQVGNPVDYFGDDDAKSCDNCGSTNGHNNSSGEFQCDNCGHSETE